MIKLFCIIASNYSDLFCKYQTCYFIYIRQKFDWLKLTNSNVWIYILLTVRCCRAFCEQVFKGDMSDLLIS